MKGMARKLEVGDKVKLSKHGLKNGPGKSGIPLERWQQAVKRNNKDIYRVLNVYRTSDEVYIGSRIPGWFKSGIGPISYATVKRDWVKKA